MDMSNLRAANVARDQEWNTGSERVSMTFRATELAGEVGEACNVIKKLERERIGLVGSRDTKEHLAEELADIVICTDLVAMDAGIDLDAAIAAKFNATSEKNGLATRLSVSDPAARTLALEEAARNLIAVRYDTYTARNGKLCSIEGDDGEKAWIVPFDAMADLESALSSPDHADAGKVEGDGLSQDVISLVIAAREVWEEADTLSYYHTDEEFSQRVKALDKALEAFSERVPYENEPSAPASEGRGMSKLTPKQTEVLRLICEGKVYQQKFGYGAWRIQGAHPTVVGKLISMGMARWGEITVEDRMPCIATVLFPATHPSGGDRHGE